MRVGHERFQFLKQIPGVGLGLGVGLELQILPDLLGGAGIVASFG